MKKFTKITLIISAIAAGIGLICLLIALATGLTWGSFRTMVRDGELDLASRWRFFQRIEERFDDDYDYDDDDNHYSEGVTNASGTNDSFAANEIDKLDIEMVAGTLTIERYNGTNIEVENNNALGYSVRKSGSELKIEGSLGGSSGKGTVVVRIPEDKVFHEMDLEIGAGDASIALLDAKEIKIDVAAGRVTMNLPGKEADYNLDLECGAGQINLGDQSYSGLGSEKKTNNSGATRKLELECGAGQINIDFEE